VVQGPEHDVLARYEMAARHTNADIIMRVTGDCPLIPPELCGEVLRSLGTGDYASNIEPRTFPQGYDCEVFTRSLLDLAHISAGESEREHVTTWMRSADIKRTNVRSPWPMEGRLTLDTEDDYRVICRAFGHEPYQRL
jgi:spore coat polysaccharide biosynthesis protein SpsF (cytidylyltransferase family)